jgi:hypothetical protein
MRLRRQIRLENKPNSSRRTPFLEIIYGFLDLTFMHTGTYPNKIKALIRCYVIGLKSGGIDLVLYADLGAKFSKLKSRYLYY